MSDMQVRGKYTQELKLEAALCGNVQERAAVDLIRVAPIHASGNPQAPGPSQLSFATQRPATSKHPWVSRVWPTTENEWDCKAAWQSWDQMPSTSWWFEAP